MCFFYPKSSQRYAAVQCGRRIWVVNISNQRTSHPTVNFLNPKTSPPRHHPSKHFAYLTVQVRRHYPICPSIPLPTPSFLLAVKQQYLLICVKEQRDLQCSLWVRQTALGFALTGKVKRNRATKKQTFHFSLFPPLLFLLLWWIALTTLLVTFCVMAYCLLEIQNWKITTVLKRKWLYEI